MRRGRHRMEERLQWTVMPRWRRRVSGLSAILATVGLIAMWPGPFARAEQDVDQIIGGGDTASALTVQWGQGLLGADNKTVVSQRDSNSPYTFMHSEFENLTVHVSQTSHLVHQSVMVTWSGGLPTQQPFQANFMQLMQCYGDAFTGPDPEGCQYGSEAMLQEGAVNNTIGSREGNLCASSLPSTVEPPRTKDGSGAGAGCDPGEPVGGNHVRPCPVAGSCEHFTYSVPFVPAGTADRFHGTVTEFYDRFNTNEVQQANTGADGKGEHAFQVLTSVEAPGLGCGLIKSDCWLVLVPRGSYDPNGWKITGSTNADGYVQGSPLGAATWAQRIQIHLSFNNVPSNCQIGSAKERQLLGTELAARAVFSWQIALNANAKCKTIYGYASTAEPVNTLQLNSADGAGFAFTTIPIGSEVTRSGGTAITGPHLIYAPMTASAITFPFHINQNSGLITSHIKLTPRLMAKALTQSYRFDLPDVDSQNAGPEWAKSNPDRILDDPEFLRLNPGITKPGAGTPRAPLLTEDHSAVNQQVWQWIIADPVAKAWLNGAPDERGMVVNPNYKDLKLGETAFDSYPRADPTCFKSENSIARVPRCTLDKLPYTHNFDDTATHIRAANNSEGADWEPLKIAPDGQTGWWGNGGIEPAGRIFLWGITSSADIANLGLIPADLCHADGSHCVSPSEASVATALSVAKPDSTGLLHVDPAVAADGAYPLVNVTYAAVRTAQSAEALQDYASFILYASSTGQKPGVEPGELPRGYLPLPDSMRKEAQEAARKLTEIAFPQATRAAPTPPEIVPPIVKPAYSPLPQGSYATRQLAPIPERFTPASPLGMVRWVLLTVIVVGLFGALGGPIIRFVGRRIALKRWRRS